MRTFTKKNKPSHDIILCQPDSTKGCSACCGLFNLRDISRQNLHRFLHNEIKIINNDVDCENFSYRDTDRLMLSIRDITSHICRFQGYIGEGKPGCTLHPKVRKKDYRDNSFFGAKICNEFLCPAHSILDSKMKHLLITHISDWYQYTVAVIDPESFLWMMNTIQNFVDISSTGRKEERRITNMLNVALELHSTFINEQKSPLFFYSVHEYNQGKADFSLVSESEKVRNHKKNIIDTITQLTE